MVTYVTTFFRKCVIIQVNMILTVAAVVKQNSCLDASKLLPPVFIHTHIYWWQSPLWAPIRFFLLLEMSHTNDAVSGDGGCLPYSSALQQVNSLNFLVT